MKKNLFLGQKSTLAFKTLTTNNVCTETIIEWNWCRKHIWENPTFTHENSLYNLGINGNLVDREYLLKIQWHCNRRSSYSDRMNVSLKITSKARLSFSTLKTVCVCMLSRLSFVQLFALLWTVAPPRLLCPRCFSRQEYFSGLPCPPPGESSQSRDQTQVSCDSCIAARFFTNEPPGKPLFKSARR